MSTPIRDLLGVSWWLGRRAGLWLPAAAAVLLVVVTLPVLDDGWAMRVLRGVGVVLACAWVGTTDDPAGEVVAASPYPRRARTLARVLAGLPVLVAAWAVVATLVRLRVPDVPVAALGVEALALGLLGVAIGVGVRAWRDLHRPAHLATLGVLMLAVLASGSPRWYALHQEQTWGPPWQAAQIRWWALTLVALGMLALALHDPLSRRPAASGHRRTA